MVPRTKSEAFSDFGQPRDDNNHDHSQLPRQVPDWVSSARAAEWTGDRDAMRNAL